MPIILYSSPQGTPKRREPLRARPPPIRRRNAHHTHFFRTFIPDFRTFRAFCSSRTFSPPPKCASHSTFSHIRSTFSHIPRILPIPHRLAAAQVRITPKLTENCFHYLDGWTLRMRDPPNGRMDIAQSRPHERPDTQAAKDEKTPGGVSAAERDGTGSFSQESRSLYCFLCLISRMMEMVSNMNPRIHSQIGGGVIISLLYAYKSRLESNRHEQFIFIHSVQLRDLHGSRRADAAAAAFDLEQVSRRNAEMPGRMLQRHTEPFSRPFQHAFHPVNSSLQNALFTHILSEYSTFFNAFRKVSFANSHFALCKV